MQHFRGQELSLVQLCAFTTRLCIQQMILYAPIQVTALDMQRQLGVSQWWPEKGGTATESKDGEMDSYMPSQAYLHLWGFPLSTSDLDYEQCVCPWRTERRSDIDKRHHSYWVFLRANLEQIISDTLTVVSQKQKTKVIAVALPFVTGSCYVTYTGLELLTQ